MKLIKILFNIIIISLIFSIGKTFGDDKAEYEELSKEDKIIINDHSGEFISTDDGCERTVEIKDIEKYSEEEEIVE